MDNMRVIARSQMNQIGGGKMVLVVKEVRKLAKEAGKQINPMAIKVLDRHIAIQVDHILRINNEKRITEKTLQVL